MHIKNIAIRPSRLFINKIVCIALFSTCFLSCKLGDINSKDYPVAKVFDTELMFSEVRSFLPPGTNRDDSILMTQNYIRNWITKKLLVNKAIHNLSNEEKNIDRLVEDYRTSLLIHQYKQKLIAQKLVAEISDKQIEQYYERNNYNFILSTPIVKAIFFIVPKSAPKLRNIRSWLLSEEAKDMENLVEYCLTNAKRFDNFDKKWVELKFILNLMPGDPYRLEKEIAKNKYLEKEDDEQYYFLKILDIANEQTVAPVEYVKDEIILILKNKTKLEFETELEKQINEEALQKKYVKIY